MSETHHIKDAFLKTLAYSAVFEYPLKENEIRENLIKQKVINNNLKEVIKKLIKKGLVKEQKGYFWLVVKENNKKLVQKREEREKISEEKIVLAKKTLKVLFRFPFIQMIGVTGSVAAGNALEEHDIDILLICSAKTVWLCRLVTVIYLKGKRKYFNFSLPKDTICPNIFLSEDSLTWRKEEQNLYTAHEVVLLKPLFSRNETYEQFVSSNIWAKKFLPNNSVFERTSHITVRFNKLPFMEHLNYFLMLCQKLYMRFRKSVTKEVLETNFIHFKKFDSKNRVLEKYSELLKKLRFL